MNIKIFTILLLVTTVVSSYGWIEARHSSEEHIEEHFRTYPLIDPSRNFINQEHYIVNIQPLREELNKLVDEFGRDSVSLYVEYLNTGANIAINPNLYLWPASLSKLPIAMIAMKKIQDGKWHLDSELVLMQGDKDSESGIIGEMLSEYPHGSRFTIENLLQELLANSDNTAFKMLVRNLHTDETGELVESLGLINLFDKEGKISSKEYSRLLRSLYTASYLDRENSEKILQWLDESTFDDFLASGLPEKAVFPHKYGEDVVDNIYADSGIVYIPDRPYMVTVITQGDPEKNFGEEKLRSSEFMRQVSQKTYEYFSKK